VLFRHAGGRLLVAGNRKPTLHFRAIRHGRESRYDRAMLRDLSQLDHVYTGQSEAKF